LKKLLTSPPKIPGRGTEWYFEAGHFHYVVRGACEDIIEAGKEKYDNAIQARKQWLKQLQEEKRQREEAEAAKIA